MQLDPAKYRHHLDRFDMSDDEKLTFMRQLWAIMESFVDRAFGESSEQILLGIDGTKCPARAQPELDSVHHLQPVFDDAANERAERERNHD